MEWLEYRERAQEAAQFIFEYMEDIRSRRVFPDVKPGYMRPLLPTRAPDEGESFDKILEDMKRVVVPGLTHWQSPHMHAYFPALNCPASLLGDMFANAFNCLGFTWASSPACTELEAIVMDWLAQAIGLPEDFLHSTRSTNGGGVIQTTASEATFVSLLAARTEAIRIARETDSGISGSYLNSQLVGYCSDQAHSSVEKAALIGLVQMRYIASENFSMRGIDLMKAIEADKEQGLVPFFVCATLGTTGSCAFDHLREVASVAKAANLWVHVDAAYAGSAFLCPEFRHWLDGIELVDSFAFNPSKWLMVHFDCTAMWVKDSNALHRTFNVDPLYLQHENSGHAIDYMHWQIPLSKRFRALKLWFVLRNYGIKGLQAHIRKGVALAKAFRGMVDSDPRFEVPFDNYLGLVVFRLKGENGLTEKLLKKLNSGGKIHCVPASLRGLYVIRFTVTSMRTTLGDIEGDWKVIQETATEVARALDETSGRSSSVKMSIGDIKRQAPDFGTSLLLSNSPMTPKIINGTFVAMFDNHESIREFAGHFARDEMLARSNLALMSRVKGIMLSDKQYSLDSRMDLMSSMVAAELSCTGSVLRKNSISMQTSLEGKPGATKKPSEESASIEEEEGTTSD
ncbi:Histidine decarboxylase [Halotydeus destructor]|nr:Histidine decarboxylase [Halotydeus destructor]